MHRKWQMYSMAVACVIEKYWDILNCKRSNSASQKKQKQTNPKSKQEKKGQSQFSFCVLQLSTICVKKRIKHRRSVLTRWLELLDGNFSLCRASIRVPLALCLLAGRLPRYWGQCLRGFCGLPPLYVGPLNPWRTWSWRNLGPWDC